MRNALALSMVVLLAFAGGCAKTGTNDDNAAKSAATDEVKAAELTPEQLGELGAQIKKDPSRAPELLSQHGLTEQTFEAQIRKVTEDPDASKRYAEAYKKASA